MGAAASMTVGMNSVCSPSFVVREGWLLCKDFTSGSPSYGRLWVVLRSDSILQLAASCDAVGTLREAIIYSNTPIYLQQPAAPSTDASDTTLVVGNLMFWSADRLLGSREVHMWRDVLQNVRHECPRTGPIGLYPVAATWPCAPGDDHTPPRQDSIPSASEAQPSRAARALFPRERVAASASSSSMHDEKRRMDAQYLQQVDQIVGALC